MDGLCGIYSLVNFFKNVDYFDDPDFPDGPSKTAFWYLLEAMAAEGLMTPHNIYNGLESQHLRSIANKLCLDHDLHFVAVPLKSVLSFRKLRSFVDLAPDLFAHPHSGAVVGEKGKNHWVLVDDWKGGYLQIRDSDNVERARVGRYAAQNIDPDGIVILPTAVMPEFFDQSGIPQ